MTACICRPRDPEGWYREDCPTHGLRCEHDWIERGTPGNEWRECWLCGEVEDLI